MTRDRIWDFNPVEGAVEVREFAWNRKGDVNAWLASEAFGLREPRSWPAEVAIQAAKQLLFELGQPKNEKPLEDSARVRNTRLECSSERGGKPARPRSTKLDPG